MTPESGWERELRERLQEIFAAEAAERLAALDAALLALEGGTAEPDMVHHLGEAFRQAHTLKGGARAAGLPDVERVSHGLESAFERLRRGDPGGPDVWGAIYAGVDAVRALVSGRAADVDRIVALLDRPTPAPAEPGDPPPEEAGSFTPGPFTPEPFTPAAVRVPMPGSRASWPRYGNCTPPSADCGSGRPRRAPWRTAPPGWAGTCAPAAGSGG